MRAAIGRVAQPEGGFQPPVGCVALDLLATSDQTVVKIQISCGFQETVDLVECFQLNASQNCGFEAWRTSEWKSGDPGLQPRW
jgi:hypothetical protein